MKVKLFRIISVLLLLSWMFLIFNLSAQVATESANTSRGFTHVMLSMLYPGFSDMSIDAQNDILIGISFLVRKAAHFCLFFILGIFSFLSFVSYKRINYYLRIVLSLAVCIIYSASDEIHQYFVPGRSCEIRDILIDTSGSLLSTLILFLITRLFRKIYLRLIGEYNYSDGVVAMRKREIMNQNYEFSNQIQILEHENERLRICLSEANDEIEKLKDIIFSLGTKNNEPVLETVDEHISNDETPIDDFKVDEPTAELDVIVPQFEINNATFDDKVSTDEENTTAEIIPFEILEAAVSDSDETVQEKECEENIRECFAVNLINDEEYDVIDLNKTDESKKEGISELVKSIEPCELDYSSRIIGRIVINAANYSNRLTRDGETRYRELVNLILGKTEVAKAEILSAITSSASEEEKKQVIDSVYEQTCEYFESVMAQISDFYM